MVTHVHLLHKVRPNRKVDPRVVTDQLGAVGRGLHDGQLVGGADAAPEQQLGRAERAGGRDDPARAGGEVHGARVAGPGRARDLDARGARALAHDAVGGGVGPQREHILTRRGTGEVRRQGPAALAAAEHELPVAKGAVLLLGRVVADHVLPPARAEALGEDVVALVQVELAVRRGLPRPRDALEGALRCRCDVRGLPACWEVLVPVGRVGLFVRVSQEDLSKEACRLTFHHSPAFTAVPPPSTQPAIWSISVHAMPDESTQIWLQRPGTSNRVRFVPSNHSGPRAPPHCPVDAGPFSMSSTEWPASLSLSAMGIPPAPPPTTT